MNWLFHSLAASASEFRRGRGRIAVKRLGDYGSIGIPSRQKELREGHEEGDRVPIE